MEKMLVLPVFGDGKETTKQASFDDLLGYFKSSFDTLPEFIRALKAADNSGWQEMINQVARHIQENPELAQLVREKPVDGQTGVSIGDPNWFLMAVAATGGAGLAFGVGFMIGTACYKLGPCNLT